MKFAILMQPYHSGEALTPWHAVDFAPSKAAALRILAKPPVRYKRKDLFCVIHTDHVSAIEQNILWLGIATNRSEIRELKPDPAWKHADSKINNWISFYAILKPYHMVSWFADAVDHRNMVYLVWRILMEVKIDLVTEKSANNYLKKISKWFDGEDILYLRGELVELSKAKHHLIYRSLKELVIAIVQMPDEPYRSACFDALSYLSMDETLEPVAKQLLPFHELMLAKVEGTKLNLLPPRWRVK